MSGVDLPVLLNSTTFCVLPWVHLCASVDGVWGRCCVDESMYYERYYRVRDKPPLILREDSVGCSPHSVYSSANPEKTYNLLEALNSQAMKDTRLSMLNGDQVPACEYCYERERGGGKSYRQIANEIFADMTGLDQLIESTGLDGTVESFPCYLDIRFGNVCNLACIMCNFPTSSRWGSMTGPIWSETRIDPYSDDAELWSILKRHVVHIRRIYFAGGEPFLQSMHFKMLDLIIDGGCAGQIDLAYSTNLTVLPKGIFDRLQKFKSVDIGASCDGLGATYEVIRSGAKWSVFVANLRQVKKYFKVRLAVTPQRHNIHQLGEIIEWGLAEDCEVDLSNILLSPKELCINHLETEEKVNLGSKYRSLSLAYYQNGFIKLAEELQGIVNFMTTDKIS